MALSSEVRQKLIIEWMCDAEKEKDLIREEDVRTVVNAAFMKVKNLSMLNDDALRGVISGILYNIYVPIIPNAGDNLKMCWNKSTFFVSRIRAACENIPKSP